MSKTSPLQWTKPVGYPANNASFTVTSYGADGKAQASVVDHGTYAVLRIYKENDYEGATPDVHFEGEGYLALAKGVGEKWVNEGIYPEAQ